VVEFPHETRNKRSTSHDRPVLEQEPAHRAGEIRFRLTKGAFVGNQTGSVGNDKTLCLNLGGPRPTTFFPHRAHPLMAQTEVMHGGANMTGFLRNLWSQEEGQDIAEYAVMLAVILVIVVGTIRLIGGSANNVFSATASSIGQ